MAIGLISASAQSSSLDTPLVGVVMKGLGDKLLAGAGFAGDEDGRVGLRDLSDGLVDLLHGRGIADDPLRLHERADLIAQHLDLAGQVPVLDDTLHGMADLVELEWLGDVVERAELHRPDGVIGRAERGHDENARLGGAHLEL